MALPTGAVREDDTLRIIAGARQYSARDKRMALHALPTGYHLDDHNGIRDPLGMCGERLGIDVHAVTADEVAIRNSSPMSSASSRGERPRRAVHAATAVITLDEAKLGVACIDFGAGTTTLSCVLRRPLHPYRCHRHWRRRHHHRHRPHAFSRLSMPNG